jgi:glycosyltransferase involved in cell wall biosynthesis
MELVLLGHHSASRKIHRAGLGESVNGLKLCNLLGSAGHPTPPLYDIYALFGTPQAGHAALARYSQLGEIDREDRPLFNAAACRLREIFAEMKEPVALLWTWDHPALGIIKAGWPSHVARITRFIATLPDHKPPALHDESTLVVCHSPLALRNWIEAGEAPWRAFYLPHHTLPRAPARQTPPEAPFTVGCVARFLAPKNIESALWAGLELSKRVPKSRFILKGGYDASWDLCEAAGMTQRLRQLLSRFHKEPWFKWDYTRSSHQEMLELYQQFDLTLHLTGWELASTVVLESMAAATPVLLLEGTTNTSLYQGAAEFVRNRGPAQMKRAIDYYHQPVQEDLVEQLVALATDPERRHALGLAGRQKAKVCFSPELTLRKSRLLIQAAKDLHAGRHTMEWQTRLTDELRCDFERHGLPVPKELLHG